MAGCFARGSDGRILGIWLGWYGIFPFHMLPPLHATVLLESFFSLPCRPCSLPLLSCFFFSSSSPPFSPPLSYIFSLSFLSLPSPSSSLIRFRPSPLSTTFSSLFPLFLPTSLSHPFPLAPPPPESPINPSLPHPITSPQPHTHTPPPHPNLMPPPRLNIDPLPHPKGLLP